MERTSRLFQKRSIPRSILGAKLPCLSQIPGMTRRFPKTHLLDRQLSCLSLPTLPCLQKLPSIRGHGLAKRQSLVPIIGATTSTSAEKAATASRRRHVRPAGSARMKMEKHSNHAAALTRTDFQSPARSLVQIANGSPIERPTIKASKTTTNEGSGSNRNYSHWGRGFHFHPFNSNRFRF